MTETEKRWLVSQLSVEEALQRGFDRLRAMQNWPRQETLYVNPREHAMFVDYGVICDVCNDVRMDSRPGRGPCNKCR